MATLTLTIPADQAHQAQALLSGTQTDVIVPFPKGFSYRDTLRFRTIKFLSPRIHFCRPIKAVTTITRTINHKPTPCAVFILEAHHA